MFSKSIKFLKQISVDCNAVDEGLMYLQNEFKLSTYGYAVMNFGLSHRWGFEKMGLPLSFIV